MFSYVFSKNIFATFIVLLYFLHFSKHFPFGLLFSQLSTQCFTIIWLHLYLNFSRKSLVASAIGKHTDAKGKETCIFATYKKTFLFYFSVSAFLFFSTSQKEQLFHAFVSRLFLRVGVRWRARIRAGPVVLKKKDKRICLQLLSKFHQFWWFFRISAIFTQQIKIS